MTIGVKRVYHLLHNELSRIDEETLDAKVIYTVDRETGEMIPIAESIPEEADEFINGIKKRNAKGLEFAMIYQESQLEMCQKLSSNAYRILGMIIGKMKWDNCSYGHTHRSIAEFLGMSTRTVNRAMRELKESGMVVWNGKKGKTVYHINPAYAWKGSFHRMKYKMPLFDEPMKEEEEFKGVGFNLFEDE